MKTETASNNKLTKRSDDGANKGFFAKLSYHTSDDASWGGDKSSEDYLAELRNSEPEREDVL